MVSKKLVGIDVISSYVEGRSYNTLMAYKKERNFPMHKVLGQWQAYVEDIDRWKEFQDNGVFFEDEDMPSRKKQPELKKRARKTTRKA